MSIGTYTDKHDEKTALYGFESFEEFIISFRAEKTLKTTTTASTGLAVGWTAGMIAGLSLETLQDILYE